MEALGQRALVREVVERGQQFALGQVARGAEDDERRRGDRQALQPFDERVLRLGLGLALNAHAHLPLGRAAAFGFAPPPGALFTACPPNWLRSAASTRSAKSPLPRERRRAYSEAVITGVGTSCAVASSIVQRPSPESSV